MLKKAYTIYSNNELLKQMAERVLEKQFGQTLFTARFAGPALELHGARKGSGSDSQIFIRWGDEKTLTKIVTLGCKIIELRDSRKSSPGEFSDEALITVTGIENSTLCFYALSIALQTITATPDDSQGLNLILLPNAGYKECHERSK